MKRRPRLHSGHPYYDLETTNYVVRVGGQYTVDYPLPKGWPQTMCAGASFFFRMVMDCKRDPGFANHSDFALELVERKAGTRRANGRMRFYQREILRWTRDKGFEDLAFDI